MGRDALKTADEALNWVKKGLNSFLRDPPDSDYQGGYLAALFETKKFLTSE
jgi:hypothetical protein